MPLTPSKNATLWSVNFTNAAAGVTPVPIADITGNNNLNIVGLVGIESTPVIDAATQTMYLIARTKEVTNSSTSYVQRLHALDIRTGAEKFGGPVVVQASVPGTGEESVGGMVPFDSKMNNQRSGLALANGQVIIAWASHEDDQPYHGWVMSYSASTLAQTGVYCVTPNGIEGGVWQSGRAPAVDPAGNVYFMTGNGTTDSSNDLSESVLRFSTKTGLALTDYFTASNAVNLNNGDVDLGSSGLILMPSIGKLVGGGKQGVFYLFDPANLGHYVPGDTQVPQKFTVSNSEIKPGPAFWVSASKGPLVYVWGESDFLKAFHFNGTLFDTTPLLQSTLKTPGGAPGATIVISANGSNDSSGILWASMSISQDGDHGLVSGMLRAVSATDPTHELWNSQLNATRDSTGYFAKFTPPVIANGQVYMASFSDYSNPNYVNVFGLLAPSPQFTISDSPMNVRVRPGNTGVSTVAIGPIVGHSFAGRVRFSVSGLPAGATASFNPPALTGAGTSTLTILTSANTPLATSTLTVTAMAVNSKITRSVPLTLDVTNNNFAISLNFVGNGTPLQPTDMAGVVTSANWNNLAGSASNAPQPLLDETGSGTGASATWLGQNPWSLPISNTPASFTMMQGYLDDGTARSITVSVTGLPAVPNGYLVYVYADGDNAQIIRTASYSMSGTGITTVPIIVTDQANTNFSGTFTQATAASSIGNYVTFVVPGPDFTLLATPVSSSDSTLRAPVNGLQIIPQ